jgi:hypothetical protein
MRTAVVPAIIICRHRETAADSSRTDSMEERHRKSSSSRRADATKKQNSKL